MSKKETQKKSLLIELLHYVVIIAVTLGISLLVQRYVVKSITIQGSSMAPTLASGENMFMYRLGTVNRFDVVVVDSPDYTVDSKGERKVYIKRVIGMPGDTIEYKSDTLYINGEAYSEEYLSATRRSLGKQLMADRTLEQILNEVRQQNPNLPVENTTLTQQGEKQVIPEGYYFVLGDNRLNSHDGDDFGLTHQRMIQGIAVLRWWPLNRLGIAPFR